MSSCSSSSSSASVHSGMDLSEIQSKSQPHKRKAEDEGDGPSAKRQKIKHFPLDLIPNDQLAYGLTPSQAFQCVQRWVYSQHTPEDITYKGLIEEQFNFLQRLKLQDSSMFDEWLESCSEICRQAASSNRSLYPIIEGLARNVLNDLRTYNLSNSYVLFGFKPLEMTECAAHISLLGKRIGIAIRIRSDTYLFHSGNSNDGTNLAYLHMLEYTKDKCTESCYFFRTEYFRFKLTEKCFRYFMIMKIALEKIHEILIKRKAILTSTLEILRIPHAVAAIADRYVGLPETIDDNLTEQERGIVFGKTPDG